MNFINKNQWIKKTFILFLALFSLHFTAQAATIYVHPNGDPNLIRTTRTSPTTLERAINLLAQTRQDIIILRPGQYDISQTLLINNAMTITTRFPNQIQINCSLTPDTPCFEIDTASSFPVLLKKLRFTSGDQAIKITRGLGEFKKLKFFDLQTAIFLDGVEAVLEVSNSEFEDVHHAVHLNRGYVKRVLSSSFHNVNQAILLYPEDTASDPNSPTLIAHNNFVDGYYGVKMHSFNRNLEVRHNRFESVGWRGVYSSTLSSTTEAFPMVIKGNYFHHHYEAIRIDHHFSSADISHNVMLDQNILSTAATIGVSKGGDETHEISITNNFIHNYIHQGIKILDYDLSTSSYLGARPNAGQTTVAYNTVANSEYCYDYVGYNWIGIQVGVEVDDGVVSVFNNVVHNDSLCENYGTGIFNELHGVGTINIGGNNAYGFDMNYNLQTSPALVDWGDNAEELPLFLLGTYQLNDPLPAREDLYTVETDIFRVDRDLLTPDKGAFEYLQ